MFGNLLTGGVVGLVLDMFTGAWQTHDDEVMVNLSVDPRAKRRSKPQPPAGQASGTM
jgi:hypothetical protein